MVLDSGIVRSESPVPHLVIAEKRRSQWERLLACQDVLDFSSSRISSACAIESAPWLAGRPYICHLAAG